MYQYAGHILCIATKFCSMLNKSAENLVITL